ncbi:MAG: HAD hydrolase-like protein [Polyangiaceae bacterium]|jgi:2-phosphoglycolate phosphatase|nr:HAD hydrolase-like protein [Polyangiaceae bacterium]MBK8940293.1 HAD hydrolase-like protein [Polyangiaceae bacterium]
MASPFQVTPGAVVFDLDGTLIDSRGDIAAAVNHALLKAGRVPLAAGVIAGFVGDGARSLLARCAKLPETDPALDDLLERFTEYYVAHPTDFTKWAEGAPQVLDRVAELELPIALCTNKPRAVTEAVLSALGVRTRFRAMYAGGDGPEKKPAPGPLIALAKRLGLELGALVMVGDGPQDVECARRAGCRVVGVVSTYSARDRVVSAQPDVVIESLSELPEIVRRWCDSTTRLQAIRPR